MEIQYLHEFQRLAELCNFQEAAEALHVSQSALTKHIQKLEEELGETLFERSARSVTLSKYGAAFLQYAQQIVAIREDAIRHLQRMRVQDDRTLVIAFPPALERYGLVELLSEFRRIHPDINIETVETVDPGEALRSRRCDFAFAQEDSLAGDICWELYKHDYPVVVLPEDHPLAKEPCVSIEQLRNEKFILHKRAQESTTIQRATLQNLCANAGFVPNIALSANFSSTIVSLVSQGLGISVMQHLQVPLNESHVAIVKLTPTVSTDIRLFYLKANRHTDVQTTFVQFVRNADHDGV